MRHCRRRDNLACDAFLRHISWVIILSRIAEESPQRPAAGRMIGAVDHETWLKAMTTLVAGASALAICALACGCTDTPEASRQSTVAALPPVRTVPIDGSYNGIAQLVTGAPTSCGTQVMGTLQVQNRMFHYVLDQPQVPWQPQRAFDVVIAPDGSFQAQAGSAYLRGQVNQGHMQGQMVGDACGYRFEADNSGTF